MSSKETSLFLGSETASVRFSESEKYSGRTLDLKFIYFLKLRVADSMEKELLIIIYIMIGV